MIVRTVIEEADGARTWGFGQGYSSYKTQQYAIEQDIKSALLEFKNNAFWDLESGIDWKTRLGFKNQKELLDTDIQNCILNRYGVVNIQNYNSNITGRDFSCSCDIYTIFSENPINFNLNR